MTCFMTQSYVKISDTVTFGIPTSASSSCTLSHQSVDCSQYTSTILRCCAYGRSSRTWITFKRFSTTLEVFVPSFYLCCTHYIIPQNFLNQPNSFHRVMFKPNAKSDIDSLLYLLCHFECDSHTVHMLTQQHLLPPLTSTMTLSLLIHWHSSPLSLAARLHPCPTNCSHYINNSWTFSRQTLYTGLKS